MSNMSVGFETLYKPKYELKRPFGTQMQPPQERSLSTNKYQLDQGRWNNQKVCKINEKSEYEPISHYLHKPIVNNRVATIHADRELNPDT
mmetsp:Transcript_5879/g.5303  ORF Transcript_5879/g.5303 Transcript_5879/m.5303 type:complete len:90 (-) Transcript_5879:347-616(-)